MAETRPSEKDQAEMDELIKEPYQDDKECIKKRDKNKNGDVNDDIYLKPDDIIMQLGGCGLFQILLSIAVQSMKTVVAWVMGGNAFFVYIPRWRCADYAQLSSDVGNYTTYNNLTYNYLNKSNVTPDSNNSYWDKQCSSGKAACVRFEYEEGIHSIIPEFDLVCDRSWIAPAIISLQMIGMMLGCLSVGHIADIFGRKKPLFSSMAMLFVFNLVCYFANDWVVFAVGRFFIGIGCAFYLSTDSIIQGEYLLSRWRSTAISFPSWAIQLSLFTLVAYLIQDWKTLTLIISLMSLALMSLWFFIPESFRWLVARNRKKEARHTVSRVAGFNKREITEENFAIMCHSVEKQQAKQGRNYSLIVLFRKRALLRLTLPLMICWFSLGAITYGINFGIRGLSGSLFLNLFLFSVAALPSKGLSILLQIKFGRKPTAIIAYSICLVGGILVGILQYIDTDYRGSLTTYFALAANTGVDMAWGPVQTFTVELFPTVARNTAFGFLNTVGRLGAVLGPQFAYLEHFLPGLLFFIVALLGFLSVACLLFLPETNNRMLVDKILDNLDEDRRLEVKA